MTARDISILRDRVARARLERERTLTPVYRLPATPRSSMVRYETDEERRQARRRTFRESKERAFGVCPTCGGRKAAHRSVKTCRPCYLASLEAPAHGTVNRYVSRRFPCRCDLCREAVTVYHRERRQRMREWRVAA